MKHFNILKTKMAALFALIILISSSACEKVSDPYSDSQIPTTSETNEVKILSISPIQWIITSEANYETVLLENVSTIKGSDSNIEIYIQGDKSTLENDYWVALPNDEVSYRINDNKLIINSISKKDKIINFKLVNKNERNEINPAPVNKEKCYKKPEKKENKSMN
jgi:hypothetical protein